MHARTLLSKIFPRRAHSAQQSNHTNSRSTTTTTASGNASAHNISTPSPPPPLVIVAKVVGNRVVFGSGVTIGRGTVLLPSAYMAPEAHVGDGRVVGALATAAHPTRRNRCGGIASREGSAAKLVPFGPPVSVGPETHLLCESLTLDSVGCGGRAGMTLERPSRSMLLVAKGAS